MAIKVPSFVHQYKFWFYLRKAVFQGIIPVLMVVLTVIDMLLKTSSSNSGFAIFMTILLAMYGNFRIFLEFIFSISSDEVVFKKDIDLTKTTKDLLLSVNLTNNSNNNYLIIIKKIFKLRYSGNKLFKYIDQTCWYLGIDCPILIPIDVVNLITNKNVDVTVLNEYNEATQLEETLQDLYKYKHPVYENVPTEQDNQDDLLLSDTHTDTSSKQTIEHLRYQIFNISPVYYSIDI